eukprot:2630520-Pyramimonas_sp.AAC.1
MRLGGACVPERVRGLRWRWRSDFGGLVRGFVADSSGVRWAIVFGRLVGASDILGASRGFRVAFGRLLGGLLGASWGLDILSRQGGRLG